MYENHILIFSRLFATKKKLILQREKQYYLVIVIV